MAMSPRGVAAIVYLARDTGLSVLCSLGSSMRSIGTKSSRVNPSPLVLPCPANKTARRSSVLVYARMPGGARVDTPSA